MVNALADSSQTGLQPALLVREIHAGYGKKIVLSGVSVEVFRGEVVAVLGVNGSGKSSLLKVIAGMLAPCKGEVFLSGQDATSWDPETRYAAGLSYLLQGGRVFHSLTVEENLHLIPRRNGQARADKESAYSLFPELRNLRNKSAALLSGGERQMLAVAMVLASRPQVALLDEPTASLFGAAAEKLLSRGIESLRSQNAAVLLVEQNQEYARGVASRILTLAS